MMSCGKERMVWRVMKMKGLVLVGLGGKCPLICPADCDKVIEHELVEFCWEERREKMTLWYKGFLIF